MSDQDNVSSDESYTIAQKLAVSGNYAAAIDAYSVAILGDPAHVKARCGRGLAFQRIGGHLEAIADFDKVIACYPNWPGVFVAYYGRAGSRQALEQYIETIEDCDEAISRNPHLVDALYLRGTARKALGQIEAAISDMDAVLSMDSSYSQAYLERGKLHYFQQHYEQAIEDLTAAIERIVDGSQDIRECLYFRAMAAQELGKHLVAIADFNRTIELGSNDGAAYLRRSWSYREMGESALADAEFKIGTRLATGMRG